MDNMDQRQDHEVINQVLKGDHQAYRILVDRYKQMVYTLAIRLVQNREDAEEVAQDAFLKAFRGLAKFRGSSKFSTWLYKIAYRASLDYLKVRSRQPYTIQAEEANVKTAAKSDPTAPMEAMERSLQIKKAIAQLPGEMGSLILLYYYEELTLKEIAKITGKTENSIKVSLHRGRNRLAELLPKQLESNSMGYANSR